MPKNELITILKRLYREHVKRHFKRLLLALLLSVVVAGSTSGIAWLLDPAVKKIFIDQNQTLAWVIPICIIIVFSSKGISLYVARLNVIKVGNRISGELQKKITNNILTSDIQTLDGRHSGKYIANIVYDCQMIQTLVSTGILNLMKDSFTLITLVFLMFYQNWKLASFAIIMMPLAVIFAKSLGKRIGKIQGEAGEIYGNFTTFISEIFKASRMIRIYQKEDVENKNASNEIDKLV